MGASMKCIKSAIVLTVVMLIAVACQIPQNTVLLEPGASSDPDYDASLTSTIGTAVEAGTELERAFVATAASTSSISASFANGSTGIMPGIPVVFTFPASINASTVNSSTVKMYETNLGQANTHTVAVRLVVQGSRLVVIPQMKLQILADCVVTIQNVAAGGVAYTHSLSWKTADLDYGLYFYGANGVCERYEPGYDNAFFNPSKPTLVYAHGWQPNVAGITDVFGRKGAGYEMFYWEENNFDGQKQYNGLKKWTNTGWLNKGWNTAIAYWTQFADEPMMDGGNAMGVPAAEAKIWSFSGPQASRYSTVDANGNRIYKTFSKTVVFDGQTKTVASAGEILGLYVAKAFANSASGLRFAGHSLGNQMTTVLALAASNAGARVDRIALLDPAWTSYEKSYLPNDGYGKWTGERVRNFIFTMKQRNPNLAVEIYHTTGLNLQLVGVVVDRNEPLTSVVCDVDLAPWYFGATNLSGKHVSARHTYMWSMESNPPPECTISWWTRSKTGKDGPSASTPDWRIREMMKLPYHWTQFEGRYTPDPSDDWFERKSK